MRCTTEGLGRVDHTVIVLMSLLAWIVTFRSKISHQFESDSAFLCAANGDVEENPRSFYHMSASFDF